MEEDQSFYDYGGYDLPSQSSGPYFVTGRQSAEDGHSKGREAYAPPTLPRLSKHAPKHPAIEQFLHPTRSNFQPPTQQLAPQTSDEEEDDGEDEEEDEIEDDGGSASDVDSISENGSESEDDIGLIDPTLTLGTVATAVLQDDGPSSNGRGRSRAYLKGSALSRERNPLHKKEVRPMKGSRAEARPRGSKRGPRKPVRPSKEFVELESHAVAALLDGDYELAESLALQATRDNPEIYSAWATLSKIYEAQGDQQRAISTLFNGAHARPRDANIWANVAEEILQLANDRLKALDMAIYCYVRVIAADKTNTEAMERRAELYSEAGNYKRVASDYRALLKTNPHNLRYLQALAEACSQLGTTEQGIAYYKEAIDHFRSQDPRHDVETFSWSDANVYADLYLILGKHKEGLRVTKELIRWIQGRESESFWNERTEDDCEFDSEASLRRTDFLQAHDVDFAIVDGLPIELRVKLGLFRLELGNHDEAMTHFSWLPQAQGLGVEPSTEYPDLYLDVANALKSKGFFQEALDFYIPIEDNQDMVDQAFLMDIAHCFRQTEDYFSAERCYKILIDADGLNVAGPEELLKMLTELGRLDEVRLIREDLNQRRRRLRAADAKGVQTISVDDPDAPLDSVETLDDFFAFDQSRMVQPVLKKPATQRRTRANDGDLLKEDFRPHFAKLKDLEQEFGSGDQSATTKWIALAAEAVEHFRAYRGFWPWDKARRFYGYHKDSRRKTLQSEYQQSLQNTDLGEDEELPTAYCDVPFTDWLDCHLMYAMLVGEAGDIQTAYEVCRMMADCSLWYRDRQAQFTIHLVWSVCATSANDHETLAQVGRFFIKQNEFATDAYRLFSALNRICSRNNTSFSKGPVQKWVMRSVRSMDAQVDKGKASRLASQANQDPSHAKKNPGQPPPKQTDVALLTMYGHMLYASSSYKSSFHYFYRAHAAEPENPVVLLSLALGYIHHSTKRQSENRHRLIANGMTFLYRYYDVQKASKNPLLLQEAEFNVARTYHLLGLLHLATQHYERCLPLSDRVQEMEGDTARDQDFAIEAAYALRGIYMQNGSSEAARSITERWLQL